MAEIPRLIEHFAPSLRDEVAAKFPPEYIKKYEEGLHGQERLGYGRRYLPIKPGFTETDLEHTCAMLDILGELKARFVYLPEEVDFREVAYMIAMHDAGEIITKDAPPFGEERESAYWQRRKRLEPKVTLRRILTKIPDPAVQVEFKHLYHRFAQQDPGDKEALLTRLLDKAQGTTRTGPTYAFDYRALNWREPTYRVLDHIQKTVSIFRDAVLDLHTVLSGDAQAELRQFTVEELDRFRPIGFSRIASTFTQRFLHEASFSQSPSVQRAV